MSHDRRVSECNMIAGCENVMVRIVMLRVSRVLHDRRVSECVRMQHDRRV